MPLPARYRELEHVSPAVEAIWTYELEATAGEAVAHIVLPDGCMDLILRRDPPEGGGTGHFLIAGPSQSPHTVSIQPGTRFVGMRFNPAWGAACLRLDPRALVDQVIPAGNREALLTLAPAVSAAEGADKVAARFRAWAAQIAAVTQPDPRAVAAIRLLQASGGRIKPSEAARLLELSPRTLRRVITAAVGLSPATLARVFRFRRSLRLRKTDDTMSLAALAHECGYSDQAHMTREFRLLGGFSPARFPHLLVS